MPATASIGHHSTLYPPDGRYRVLKSSQIDGVLLRTGDELPAESGLRQNPRRIETLCRLRVLAPVTALHEKANPGIGPAENLDTLTNEQLRDRLRKKGLDVRGSKLELVARLRSALGS